MTGRPSNATDFLQWQAQQQIAREMAKQNAINAQQNAMIAHAQDKQVASLERQETLLRQQEDDRKWKQKAMNDLVAQEEFLSKKSWQRPDFKQRTVEDQIRVIKSTFFIHSYRHNLYFIDYKYMKYLMNWIKLNSLEKL